jgi:hypothetical protein
MNVGVRFAGALADTEGVVTGRGVGVRDGDVISSEVLGVSAWGEAMVGTSIAENASSSTLGDVSLSFRHR